MSSKRDLNGKRFGRLTVVAEAQERASDGKVRWECVCDCSEAVTVIGRNLTSGNTTSCGCYRSQYVATKNRRHGKAARGAIVPEYGVWCGIIKRCTDQDAEGYVNYGGRGIQMCPAWRDSFETFFADMGPRPSAAHSIERINNERGYEPGNCKWGTRDEQNNNKRSNVRFTIKGETLTAKQMWQKHAQSRITYSGFVSRLQRGWSAEEALFT